MTTTVTAKIQIRRGTAAAWTSANPTLLSGEVGYETDTGKQKIGDGTTAWTALAYYHDPDGAGIYAPIAKGVTNGDSHDHSGGDGGQIAYSSLSSLPTLGTAAATAATDYATASHNHSGTYEPADATIIKQADVDDVPVDGVTTAPVSSNWAFDHAALTTAHGISTFGASLVDDADVGTARSTLGLGTAATTAATDYATAAHAHEGTAILSTGETGGTKFLREDGDGTCSWQAAAGGVASDTHAASDKATPVDADELPLVDSAASFVLKKLTWANLKTTLAGVFAVLAGKSGGQTIIGGTQVADKLTLQGTTGNGTVTATALEVKVGNNGALSALNLLNSGQLVIQGDATTDLPVYGAELLTTAGWTVNTGWTESPDDTFAHSSGTDTLTHSATITSGYKYQISWVVTGRTAGSFTVAVGGVSLSSQTASGNTGPTATATTAFTITPTTDFNGTISSISLKRLTAVSTPDFVWKTSAGVVVGEIRGGSTTNNCFVGVNAGRYNTTGGSNSAFGVNALQNNTTGYNNNAVGYQALQANSTGFNNSAFGVNAGAYNTTGSNNSAVGMFAIFNNTTGGSNSSVGSYALFSNTTGGSNSALGSNALFSNTTGGSNSALGSSALFSNTTGGSNSAVGREAGRYHADGTTALTDPENSVYIGYLARGKDNSDSNSVVIGGNIPIGLGANTTVLGTSATTITRLYGNVATGVDAPSAAFHAIKTTEQLRLGYDASNYASFTVDASGNLTIAPTGTTPSIYIGTLRSGVKITPVTTTASPAATDTRTVYTNEGDADGATVTLPTAVAGLQFTAYVQTAQTLTITAAAGDTIRIASSVTAAAGSITSAVVGSSVTLVAINSVEWVATSSVGSWTI